MDRINLALVVLMVTAGCVGVRQLGLGFFDDQNMRLRTLRLITGWTGFAMAIAIYVFFVLVGWYVYETLSGLLFGLILGGLLVIGKLILFVRPS
jgi:hypothetical protein